MNWKKGLFRIWLVLSVIWVALFAWYVRPDIAYQQYAESRKAFMIIRENAQDIDINACKEFEVKPWQRYGEIALSPHKMSIDVVIACHHYLKKAEKVDEKHTTLLFANMGWSSREFNSFLSNITERKNLDYKNLRDLIIWLVIPPFILFVLGVAVLWAIAGFRSRS